MDLDATVRWHVYDVTMSEGAPPRVARLASTLNLPEDDVRAALERLAEKRMLVMRGGEILMAGPFSAVPTPFLVTTPRYACYGNCIWDALGIAATLQSDARVDASCGDCGAAMQVEVRDGAVAGSGSIHFALPARQWWQDVVFT